MRRYRLSDYIQKVFHLGVHRDGIRAIYWGVVLRQFAASAVGLFVPVFVFQLARVNYHDSFIEAVRILILFLIIARISVIISSLISEYLIDSVGFRWSLLVSSMALIFKFILLSFSEININFLWLAALVSGFATSLYWIARHALFGEDQDITHVGSSLGIVIVLSRIATILGPITGGFIAYLLGFTRLFYFGLVIVFFSSIPYFFMKHHRRHNPDGWKGLMDKVKDKKNWPLMVSWFGRSWDDDLIINFWPLYIFVVLEGVEKVGIIHTLVATISLIAAYISGYIFDKVKARKKIFIAGSIVNALIWPFRAMAMSFWSVFSIDSVHSIVSSFYGIPFLSQTYRFSFRRDTVAFFVFREIVFSVGIICYLFLAYIITFSWSWVLLFILGSVGVLISTNIVKYIGFE